MFLIHNNPNGQPSPIYILPIFQICSPLSIYIPGNEISITSFLDSSNSLLNDIPEVDSPPCFTSHCLILHSVARMICDKWKSNHLSFFSHLELPKLLSMFGTKPKVNVACKVLAWFFLSSFASLLFFPSGHCIPFA